jgi:hypothetical protein
MIKVGRPAVLLLIVSTAACATTRDYARPTLPEDVEASDRTALFEAHRLVCTGPACRHGDGSLAQETDGAHPGFSQTEQRITSDRFIRQGVMASGVALFTLGAYMGKNFSDDMGKNLIGSDSSDAGAALASLGIGLAVGAALFVGAMLWPEPDVEGTYNDALQQELDQRYLLTEARRRVPPPAQLSQR